MLCKLIHFSDTHEIATLEHWHACFDKRLIGFFNSNVIRKSRYDRALIAPAVEMMLAEKPGCQSFLPVTPQAADSPVNSRGFCRFSSRS